MIDQGLSANDYLQSTGANWKPAGWLFPLLAAFPIFAAMAYFQADWHFHMAVKWLPVGFLATVCLGKLALYCREPSARFDLVDFAAVLLLAWVATSLAWTPDSLAGREVLLRWTFLTVIFITFRRIGSPGSAQAIMLAIAAGLLAVIALNRLEIGVFAGYDNQNYEAEALLLGLPFLYSLWRDARHPAFRWGAIAIAVVVVSYLIFANPSKVKFAVWAFCGLFLVIVLLWKRSRMLAAVAVAAILSAIAGTMIVGWDTPLFGASHGFRLSFYPRFELLINTLAIWFDAPLLGHGAGSYVSLYPVFQETHLAILGHAIQTGLLREFTRFVGAAHNEYAQFLASFGLVGAAWIAAGIFFARKSLATWHQSSRQTAGLFVVLSVVIISTIDFPFQFPASALLAIIGLAWLFPATEDGNASRKANAKFVRAPILILFLAAIPLTGWWGYRFSLGHSAYGEMMRVFKTQPDQFLILNLAAIGAYPLEEVFRYQLFFSLMTLDEIAERPVVSPEDHDRAFSTSLTAGPGNGLLIFRLQYLLNTGLYRNHRDETDKWRQQLKMHATQMPDTWLMEGLYEVADNHPDKAKAALDRYLELTGGVVSEERKAIVENIRRGLTP